MNDVGVTKVRHVERARLAYETFRGGFSDVTKIPRWEKAPGWIRDAVLVAYLQGTLDAPRPFYGAECPSYPVCKGGCGLGCTHEIEQNRVHKQ
jgi:hypothetical protein